MKAVFAIILSLAFALHGNAMSCIDGLCQVAAANDCCAHDSALDTDSCCPEVPASSDDCHTECELKTHQHQSVVLYEQSTQVVAPALRLIALLDIFHTPAPTQEQVITHTIEAPIMSDYSVGYCVWRL